MPDTFKQVAEKLNNSGTVLVVLPPLASPDAVTAGLGLANFIKRLAKEVAIVSADGQANNRVDFLPGYNQILREINITKGFVIEVSTKQTPVSELTYKKDADKLSIYLKPRIGEFTPADVTFHSSQFPYDAVVVIGTQKLESLGEFYAKHAPLFFETPVINIDFRGANESYGQFNLINLNASSLSEIVYDLISEIDKELIDADIATMLLTGIITETNSFQHSRTTPQVFMKASQLVGLGGRQQDIIVHLYKSKSLGFLKLWGRVLARMKHEPENSLVYSAVNRLDMEKSGAAPEDAAMVLKEMNQQLGFAKIYAFFREVDAQITEVYCSAPAVLNLAGVFAEYQPAITQPQSLKITLNMSLVGAEETVLEILRREAKKLS